MVKALLRENDLKFRKFRLQRRVNRLSKRLLTLRRVTEQFLPQGTRAHSINLFRELELRLRLNELHYQLDQIQQQLGVL